MCFSENTLLGNYAFVIGVITACLTSIYSWRLFLKTFHGTYNNTEIQLEETHESPKIMLFPLLILSVGAIFSGYLFKDFFIGNSSDNFWGESIFFLENIKHDYIPLWLLLITPTLVILIIPITYYYFIYNPKVLEEFKKTNLPLYNFLLNKWYIDEFYDFVIVKPIKKIGSFFGKKGILVLLIGSDQTEYQNLLKLFQIKLDVFKLALFMITLL